MADVNRVERRLYPRAEVRWPVTIQTAQGQVDGETRHVSFGGVCVLCREPLSRNEIFSMTISPPNRSPLKVTAEIVWVDMSVPSDDKIIPLGMGARFTKISDEDRQFLYDVVFDLKTLDDTVPYE